MVDPQSGARLGAGAGSTPLTPNLGSHIFPFPLSCPPSSLNKPPPLLPNARPQAVFSRPVIALGGDWGVKELPPQLVPFTLTCGTPGRLRWVTTNIARFDPSVDWPTDLDCQFKWNTGLKGFDGEGGAAGVGWGCVLMALAA